MIELIHYYDLTTGNDYKAHVVFSKKTVKGVINEINDYIKKYKPFEADLLDIHSTKREKRLGGGIIVEYFEKINGHFVVQNFKYGDVEEEKYLAKVLNYKVERVEAYRNNDEMFSFFIYVNKPFKPLPPEYAQWAGPEEAKKYKIKQELYGFSDEEEEQFLKELSSDYKGERQWAKCID